MNVKNVVKSIHTPSVGIVWYKVVIHGTVIYVDNAKIGVYGIAKIAIDVHMAYRSPANIVVAKVG